jgi:hypothetical protein
MPLTFPSPPRDALATLKQGLQAVRSAQILDPRGGAVLAVPPAPTVTPPYPVYELSLDDLVAGRGLEAARLVAWRYLLVTNQKAQQAAEIFPAAGGGSRFGALTTGFVAAEEQAVTLADQLPEVQQGTYEIRSLRVPALYVVAIWLKDQQGDEDRFLVLPPAFPPLQTFHPYPAADLVSLLQRAAAQKAALERAVTPP